MNEQDFTALHRKTLQAQMDAARAAREAEAKYAREQAASLPPTGEPDKYTILWNKAGYYAWNACLMALFIAPILLVLEFWD